MEYIYKQLSMFEETCNFNFFTRKAQAAHEHNTNTALHPYVELNTSNLLSYFPLVESTSKPKNTASFVF